MKKYIYTAVILVGFVLTTSCEDFLTTDNKSNVTDKEYFSTKTEGYLQPIITQYFIDNKSEIWLLFLIAHSKR